MSKEKWRAPTRADEVGHRASLAHPSPKEPCPLCGNPVALFELARVDSVGCLPGQYACGGCRSTVIREGVLTLADLAHAQGAPAAKVKAMRAAQEPTR